MDKARRRLVLAGLVAAALILAAAATTLLVFGQSKTSAIARPAETAAQKNAPRSDQLQADGQGEDEENGDYNSEAEEIGQLAAAGGDAREDLARLFVARSWQAIYRNEGPLAARYALAGWRVAPAIESRYRAALHRILGVEESRVLRGHEGPIVEAALSPDGSRVVTASRDHTARLWDAATGHERAVLRGHTRDVLIAAFSSDGAHILTAAQGRGHDEMGRDREGDRIVRVWDSAGRGIATLEHGADVNGAAFSPDGARIVTASDVARLWDARTGRLIATLDGPGSSVQGAAFSRNGARIVTVEDGAAVVWDAATGRRIAVMRDDEEDGGGAAIGVRRAIFTPDGQVVALSLGGMSRVWRTWDAATGRQLEGQCCSDIVILSEDGAYILEANRRGFFSVKGLLNRRETPGLFEDENENALTGFAMGINEARFITLSDHVARLWDFRSGRELAVLRGHEEFISSVAMSPNGAHILTASWDKTARIWNIARLLRPMHEVARAACADFLDAGARRFSAQEIAADPLIRVVWLGGRNANRDVCAGVAGARSP